MCGALRFSSALIVVLAASSFAAGAIYSGSLSSALGQIEGREGWVDPGPTNISWVVTALATHFHYKYVLTVPDNKHEISHFTIEVSSLFGGDDFWNATGPFGSTEIGDFDQSNGNPSIPAPIHGLKFDDMYGTTAVIEFDSIRRPVWGDFYAKNGGLPPNEAWSEGLAVPDPLDPPANGSILNHILVPDTVTPEPASLMLLAAGGWVIARRNRVR